MQITLINKQRKYKIDLAHIEEMAEKLSAAVLSNLMEKKPNWIKRKSLFAIKKHALINLIFVSNFEIKNLNRIWLNKNKETDVLSFPLVDLCEVSSIQQNLLVEQETEAFVLGEIFIAYEVACRQAKEYEHSIDREIAFLFIHGMLHILGFDHQEKVSEKDMFGRQRQILKKCGYERNLTAK